MKRVRVYWNLHKLKWSVLYKGKVEKHADIIFLKDVRFIVSENGRKKVIATKQKNVHAYAEGIEINVSKFKRKRNISYNPYRLPYFFNKDDLSMVLGCRGIVLENKKIQEIEVLI